MSESKPRINNAVQILRVVLVMAAVLVLVASCALAFVWCLSHDPGASQTLLVAAACVLAGLVTAVLMIVASSVVGMLAALVSRLNGADDVRPALERLEQSLRVLNSMQSRAEAPRPDAAATGGAADIRTQHVLEQIRDLTLMNDAQRTLYAARHWARRKQIHLDAIEREVLVGDWVSAFARLEELQIVLPGDEQMAELRVRVESEQMARLEEDVRVARGRLRQLMSATLWQQAEDLAAALQAKYPGKAEAQRLGEDVRREREAFERESMERLFKDITAATERHQWRQAILAVDEFIRRYPLDERSDKLRLDLPTLQENAAAQERKEQEENFKDLLKRQRYDEAILTAKAVIAKYPQSATATELTRLLPKVEELAKQEALRVANQAQAAAQLAAAATA
jgi:hypothetical protein